MSYSAWGSLEENKYGPEPRLKIASYELGVMFYNPHDDIDNTRGESLPIVPAQHATQDTHGLLRLLPLPYDLPPTHLTAKDSPPWAMDRSSNLPVSITSHITY